MKITRRISYVLIILFFLITIYYYESHTYKGDGTFTNNGFMAATDRYVIDFGEIDLSSKKSYTYMMSHLPNENFTIGLHVTALKKQTEPIYETKKINPLIHLVVTNAKGELVIDQKTRLSEWVWSGGNHAINQSFIYIFKQLSPQLLTSYALTLDIIEPDKKGKDYKASARLKSGGWK